MKEYEQIMRQKGLPEVGQTVRSKKYGTLWRVMEKRETWMNIDDDPKSQQPRMIPSIYLAYWKIREGAPPGVGKMMGTFTPFMTTPLKPTGRWLAEKMVPTNGRRDLKVGGSYGCRRPFA